MNYCPICNDAPGDAKTRNKGFFETISSSISSRKSSTSNTKLNNAKKDKNRNSKESTTSFTYHTQCYKFKGKYKGVGQICPVTKQIIKKVNKLDKDFKLVQSWDQMPEVLPETEVKKKPENTKTTKSSPKTEQNQKNKKKTKNKKNLEKIILPKPTIEPVLEEISINNIQFCSEPTTASSVASNNSSSYKSIDNNKCMLQTDLLQENNENTEIAEKICEKCLEISKKCADLYHLSKNVKELEDFFNLCLLPKHVDLAKTKVENFKETVPPPGLNISCNFSPPGFENFNPNGIISPTSPTTLSNPPGFFNPIFDKTENTETRIAPNDISLKKTSLVSYSKKSLKTDSIEHDSINGNLEIQENDSNESIQYSKQEKTDQLYIKLKELYPNRSPTAIKLRIQRYMKDWGEINFCTNSISEHLTILCNEYDSDMAKNLARIEEKNSQTIFDKNKILDSGSEFSSKQVHPSPHKEPQNLTQNQNKINNQNDKSPILTVTNAQQALLKGLANGNGDNAQKRNKNIVKQPLLSLITPTYNQFQTPKNTKEDISCMICLEEFNNKLAIEIQEKMLEKLICNHKFHKKCINQWRNVANNNSCPTCREITLDEKEFPEIGVRLKEM